MTRFVCSLFVALLLLSSVAFADFEAANKAADLFVREAVTVEAGQRIGRLFGAGAAVTVQGVIEKGIVLVDGDLAVASSARINGPILVLGGSVSQAAGVQLEKLVLVLPPGPRPFADMLFAAFFIGLGLAIAILPASLWLFFGLAKQSAVYRTIMPYFSSLQRRWPGVYIVLALSASAMLLEVFVELAWKTLFRQQMEAVDNLFIWLVRYHANPSLDRIMVTLSALGAGYAVALIAGAALLTLVLRHRRWEALALALCLGGSAVLNTLLKLLFERSRPELLRLVDASGYSFPSGHAMVSLCLYGMLALLAIRRLSDRRLRLLIVTIAAGVVAGIGISRIYLGVHYPSDVAAGFAAGGMWLVFCISLLVYWEKRALSCGAQ